MKENLVLVVDDEALLRTVLSDVLEAAGFRVALAESAEKGLKIAGESKVAAALVDLVLPGMNGVDMLAELKTISPDTEVVIITGHASLETALGAIRNGAYDYIRKPFEDGEVVLNALRRALEKRNLILRNRALMEEQERRNRQLTGAVSRLSTLLLASHALGTFQSLPELLASYIKLLSDELDVERASIMLVDEKSAELRIAAHQGIEDVDVQAIRVPLGTGIAGTVAKTGKPILVQDADNDARVEAKGYPNIVHDSFMSAPIMLSLPIKYQESVLGVINVTNRRSGRPFDEEDLSYLSGLSGQLAVAIERARQFQALQEAHGGLRAAQERLVFAERLKALGQMTSGVVHDFNNGLTVVLGRLEILRRKVEKGQVEPALILSELDTIRKTTEKGAKMIRRIQDLAQARADIAGTPLDLNAIVRDAIDIARSKWTAEESTIPGPIEIETDLGEPPDVHGDRFELLEALEGLLNNGVEAMPQGGSLSIRTRAGKDGSAIVEVTDSGVGMSEETRRHLFEPFFTTKGRGRGLGLSIVHGIVARHRGEIEVESRHEAGTTLRIRLPRAVMEPVKAPAEAGPANEPVGVLEVLLIDDDEIVLDTHSEILSSAGHRVTVAPGGTKGLELFGSREFDVVITDLSMEGMSGLDVASEVKRLHPSTPVILLSGWGMPADDEKIRSSGVDDVLAKPCSFDDLVGAVEKVLRSRPAARA